MTTGRINQVSIVSFPASHLSKGENKKEKKKKRLAALFRFSLSSKKKKKSRVKKRMHSHKESTTFFVNSNLLKRVCFFCAPTNWCATETRMNAFTFLASLSQLQFASAFDFPSHSYLDNDAWRKTVKRREKKEVQTRYNSEEELVLLFFSLFFSWMFFQQILPNSATA